MPAHVRAELSIHPFIHLPIWHLPAYPSILTSNALALLLSRAPNYCKRPRNTCNEARATGSSGCCRVTMAVHALTFLMTINPRTIRGCATTISDNTLAGRREWIVGRASETESVAWAPHALTHAYMYVLALARTHSCVLHDRSCVRLLTLTYASPLARAYRALRM